MVSGLEWKWVVGFFEIQGWLVENDIVQTEIWERGEVWIGGGFPFVLGCSKLEDRV